MSASLALLTALLITSAAPQAVAPPPPAPLDPVEKLDDDAPEGLSPAGGGDAGEAFPTRVDAPHAATAATVPEGRWELRAGLGLAHRTLEPNVFWPSFSPALTGSLTFGITDRLQWLVPVPAFAYRFGERGGFEWILRGGATSLGFGYANTRGFIFSYGLGVGLDSRLWIDDGLSVIVTWGTATGGHFDGLGVALPITWSARLAAGASLLLIEGVTLHVGVGMSGRYLVDGRFLAERPVFSLGSVQSLAFRRLPFLQVQLDPSWTFDVYLALSYDAEEDALRDEYLLGFTWMI